MPGWTIEGNFTAVPVQRRRSGFPTLAQSASWSGGANFFAGGPDTAASAATQSIDVAGAAPEIDAGGVTLALLALIGGYDGPGGRGDGDGDGARRERRHARARTTLAAVTMAERNPQTTLLARSATAPVPRGTRSITVRLAATRTAGNYNDGYVDNVSLTLPAARRTPGASTDTVRRRRRSPAR